MLVEGGFKFSVNARLLPRLDDPDLPLFPKDVRPAEREHFRASAGCRFVRRYFARTTYALRRKRLAFPSPMGIAVVYTTFDTASQTGW
jgi:hypothetical protein